MMYKRKYHILVHYLAIPEEISLLVHNKRVQYKQQRRTIS